MNKLNLRLIEKPRGNMQCFKNQFMKKTELKTKEERFILRTYLLKVCNKKLPENLKSSESVRQVSLTLLEHKSDDIMSRVSK